MIVYDLPPGYTRFRARAALDHGPSNNITFAVYLDNPLLEKDNAAIWKLHRDPETQPSPSPSAYVEMISGDRLPGEVIGYVGPGDVSNGLVPPHWFHTGQEGVVLYAYESSHQWAWAAYRTTRRPDKTMTIGETNRIAGRAAGVVALGGDFARRCPVRTADRWVRGIHSQGYRGVGLGIRAVDASRAL